MDKITSFIAAALTRKNRGRPLLPHPSAFSMLPRVVAISGLSLAFLGLYGCLGGLKKLKVSDFTEQRITDLSLTRRVTGKREFLFFSTVKTGSFFEGSIQGEITDYTGNPIEGVTVRAMPSVGRLKAGEGMGETGEFAAVEESASASVSLSFTPGISDSMGLYKIRFSLPIVNGKVDVKGKLVYNPGWDQQKLNLGTAYEPQVRESSFRLFYSMNTGFLIFAEGIRKTIVQPVGDGRVKTLPGSKAPGAVRAAEPAAARQPAAAGGADPTEEDLFKGFDFGQ